MELFQKLKRSFLLPWIIVGLLVISMSVEAFAYHQTGGLNPLKMFSKQESKTEKITTPVTPASVVDKTPVKEKTETIAAPKRIVDVGVNWIEPQKLGDQGFFKETNQEDYLVKEAEYYKIANLSAGGELILATLPINAPSRPLTLRFLKDAAGKYFFLRNASDGETSAISTILADKITPDYDTKYGQLDAPGVLLTDKNIELSISTSGTLFFSELKNPVKLDDSVYGTIYKTAMQPEGVSLFTTSALYLKHGDSTLSGYTIKSSDLKGYYPEFSLLNGQKNTLNYYPIEGVGCGSPRSASILLDTTNIINRLEIFGKTTAGNSIYTIKDPADKIYDSAYNIYLKYNSEPAKAITRAAYVTQKAVIIWQDNLGDYEAFVKEGLQIEEGYGKPVVYLYPTKTMDVKVAVGAKITISEPAYQNGWKATASPSGQLVVNGQKYPYLYWEGIGYGQYPQIDFGTIVKQTELKTTLLSQLTKLGLNQKEQSDFMEFWWTKMPKTPYVRLSWLGTSEMERLAPLSITPKPDTKIRIFLDFAGLDQPIALKSQKLSAPARKGFTAVEWGGLLRSTK